uniref:Uncharacterized protein n=1 Tax=Rhizophora mucronata TaxID=61149 RepID=A0A2P2P5F7_RHIMU
MGWQVEEVWNIQCNHEKWEPR